MESAILRQGRPNRDWYAPQAAAGGWSRAVLLNQIRADALGRTGAALTNFATQLPAPDSDLAHGLLAPRRPLETQVVGHMP